MKLSWRVSGEWLRKIPLAQQAAIPVPTRSDSRGGLEVHGTVGEKVDEALDELGWQIEMDLAQGENLMADKEKCDEYLDWIKPIVGFLKCDQSTGSDGPSKDASSADVVMEEALDNEQQAAQLVQPGNGEALERLQLRYRDAEVDVKAAMGNAEAVLMSALGRHTKARTGYLSQTPVTRGELRQAIAVALKDTERAKTVLQKLAK
ncbi:hypothetical protein LTR17_020533 [Elasticomyces elasticus]|nr:hypothetical protein LTR17_020533 [Elasticomyces elasticus]